ncbi:PcfK-like family protein [Ihubacter massiliensis]|uniref:Cas9 inhibitor AcrIIA9 family protein n=1 Tax=Ihubacter massiliensis TaxID=1852367 RepID=UPI0020980ACA|nr:Cas9 inhibitor AcrIIA9 family protein [Ihubacter massiliensis]MCI7301300.1 PcfK-like family protein [Clostridia bacterium]MCO7120572.1 PcfK-like family protein [Ihubacter massiliensis]MDY3010621.1 Cas9 inhibitor AcrIIA9 family protein [Clostridiales Family XIII bacterium]
MIDKAIAQITDEMMIINQPLIQLIEEHLTSICTTEAVAEKLLAKDKSLRELNDAIWSEAEKRKSGKGAYIPEPEIFTMAEAYYGITKADKNTSGSADVIDILDLI